MLQFGYDYSSKALYSSCQGCLHNKSHRFYKIENLWDLHFYKQLAQSNNVG